MTNDFPGPDIGGIGIKAKKYSKAGFITIDLKNIYTRNQKYHLHDDTGFIKIKINPSGEYMILEEWRLSAKTNFSKPKPHYSGRK